MGVRGPAVRGVLLLALAAALTPRAAGAAGEAPLPAWATLPTKRTPARALQLSAAGGAVMGAITAGLPVRLSGGGRLFQTGAARWGPDPRGTVPVRLELGAGWLAAVAPADRLLLPLPAGTAAAAAPGGPTVAMTLAPATLQPVGHRGGQTQGRITPAPGVAALTVWIADDRLELTAVATPIPAAWRRPGRPLPRRGPRGQCGLALFVEPRLEATTARPFRQLTVCQGRGLELRVTERRGAWTRLWVREGPKAVVALAGWIHTPPSFGVRPCQCGAGQPDLGTASGRSGGSYRAYFARRDLPLYAKADRGAQPVGVLHKQRYQFAREDLPGAHARTPDFVPVELHGARLWVPYHPAFFEDRRVNR